MGVGIVQQLLFSQQRRRPFSVWQIELTTRCLLRCRMCIREGVDAWQKADMEMEDFRRLTPYFKDVETVVLEGWGESLLHKNLIEAVKLVKAEGSQAGLVTSGKGLNRDFISKLIDAGIDFIGFSLAGATAEIHNFIRVNSEFQSIRESIQIVREIREEKRLEKPQVHIVYLMLKDNIGEVPALPQLAHELGVKHIVLINLIQVTNEWQDRQRVYRCTETGNEEREYGEILKEAKVKSEKMEIQLRQSSLAPVEAPVCEENPLKNLYISVDGEVSPCVYLYPPVPSPFQRIYCGTPCHINKVSFGNILREPFQAIWNNRRYVEFRNRFTLREKKFEERRPSLRGRERIGGFDQPSLPDPPEPCTTCHKMLGL